MWYVRIAVRFGIITENSPLASQNLSTIVSHVLINSSVPIGQSPSQNAGASARYSASQFSFRRLHSLQCRFVCFLNSFGDGKSSGIEIRRKSYHIWLMPCHVSCAVHYCVIASPLRGGYMQVYQAKTFNNQSFILEEVVFIECKLK